MTPGIICKDCGVPWPRTSPRQFFCTPCSDKRHQKRKREWAAKHHPPRDRARRYRSEKLSRTAQNGIALSLAERDDIGHAFFQPRLLWAIRVSVPFSYAASKNHIHAMSRHGHVFMRAESRAVRDELTLALKTAVKDRKIVHAKVWIAIFVQKPNHKGDAVNVIDLVCDAVKDAIGIDDRWFSLRQLDWQITKTEPELYVEIGQTTDIESQPCSSCGRILPLDRFGKKSATKLGVDRNCRECRFGPDKK